MSDTPAGDAEEKVAPEVAESQPSEEAIPVTQVQPQRASNAKGLVVGTGLTGAGIGALFLGLLQTGVISIPNAEGERQMSEVSQSVATLRAQLDSLETTVEKNAEAAERRSDRLENKIDILSDRLMSTRRPSTTSTFTTPND